MACAAGCAGGGGQPKKVDDFIRQNRVDVLYLKDEETEIRSAHNNPEIKQIYSEFLGEPLGETSEMLLHTTYFNRSSEILKQKGEKLWNLKDLKQKKI